MAIKRRAAQSRAIQQRNTPIRPADLTDSMRRQSQQIAADAKRTEAQLMRNESYMQQDAKAEQAEYARRGKELQEWGKVAVEESGGIWKTIAQFSPIAKNVFEELATKQEEEDKADGIAHAIEDYAATGILPDTGNLDQEEELGDTIDMAASNASPSLAENKMYSANARLQRVSGHYLNAYQAKHLELAAKSTGPRYAEWLRTSEDEISINTPNGTITITPKAAYEAGDEAAMSAALAWKTKEDIKTLQLPGLDQRMVNKYYIPNVTEPRQKILNAAIKAHAIRQGEVRRNDAQVMFYADGNAENLIKRIKDSLDTNGQVMTPSRAQEIATDMFYGAVVNRQMTGDELLGILRTQKLKYANGATYAKWHGDRFAVLRNKIRTWEKNEADADGDAAKDRAWAEAESIVEVVGDDPAKAKELISQWNKKYYVSYGYHPMLERLESSLGLNADVAQTLIKNFRNKMLYSTATQLDWNALPPSLQPQVKGEWDAYQPQSKAAESAHGRITQKIKTVAGYSPDSTTSLQGNQISVVGSMFEWWREKRDDYISKGVDAVEAAKNAEDDVIKEFDRIQSSKDDANHGWRWDGNFKNWTVWKFGRTGEQAIQEGLALEAVRRAKIQENPKAYLNPDFYGSDAETGLKRIQQLHDQAVQDPSNPNFDAWIKGIANKLGVSQLTLMNQVFTKNGLTPVTWPGMNVPALAQLSEGRKAFLENEQKCNFNAQCRFFYDLKNVGGEPLWKQGKYKELIEAVPPELQPMFAGIPDTFLKYNRGWSMEGEATPERILQTVRDGMTHWDTFQQTNPQQAAEIKNLTPEKDMWPVLYAVTAMSAAGPGGLVNADVRELVKDYAKASIMQTSDPKFKPLLAHHTERFAPPASERVTSLPPKEVMQSISAGTPQENTIALGKWFISQGYSVWQHKDFNLEQGYTGTGQERVWQRPYKSTHQDDRGLDLPGSHNSIAQLDALYEQLVAMKAAGAPIGAILWRGVPGHGPDIAPDNYHIHVDIKVK